MGIKRMGDACMNSFLEDLKRSHAECRAGTKDTAWGLHRQDLSIK